MKFALGVLLALITAAASGRAQADERVPVYRGLSAVLQLRVVCSSSHFGRLEDLVVDVRSGRITAGVVDMAFEKGTRLVAVPFPDMRFEVESNMWNLGTCRHEDDPYPVFDPATVKVRRKPTDSDTAEVEGTMLASSLIGRAVTLSDGAARARDLAIELRSGHIAFLHVAIGRERAGDRELHPVPWSAFRSHADGSSADQPRLRLTLPHDQAFVEASPNLIEIIVQDPLRRARVYAIFGVPAPDFDNAQ